MEKKMETTIIGYIMGLYRGYIGIMEKKMETITVCRGFKGIIETRMLQAS